MLVIEGIVVELKSVDRRQNNVSVDTERRSDAEKYENSSLFCALEAVPPIRRTLDIPDKIEHGEITSALGMAGLALINLPEDFRDVKSALEQFKGIEPKYDYKDYQHDFSFFRGTAIEKWLHKHVDAGKKWANWLYDNDRTVSQTTFGRKLLKATGGKEKDVIETSIENFKGNKALGFMHEGSKFGQLTGRALRRTTKLGVLALALLEVPKIITAIQKGETIEQTAKSAVNVASITAGISYGGAIGAKYGKALGSLVGMGFGAVLGSKLSNGLQKAI